MTKGIEDFSGLHAVDDYPAHYLSFTNGGRPAQEVLDVVHGILKDVNDERYGYGIVDAGIAKEVGGTVVRAIVDHTLTAEELDALHDQGIRAEEFLAA